MPTRSTVIRRGVPLVVLTGALLAGTLAVSGASSHREAPLSSQDPVSDLTDVYAFMSPDRPDTVTLLADVIPFQDPAGGPNFYRFGDDVLYEINVDSDGDALPDKSYEFDFGTITTNPNTFLYNTNQVTSLNDADQNVVQFYSLTEVDRTGRRPVRSSLGHFLPVPPANVGPRSMPNYEEDLAAPAVKEVSGGIKVFAGPRDDPFFVDLGSIFDLGGLRPLNTAHLIPLPTEPGKDYVAGKNVHTLALQIPVSRLVENGDPVLGVWASTYRRGTTVLDGNGGLSAKGKWVQVSRLGMPLVNEVVMPVGVKDVFNASKPSNDLASGFGQYVVNPELGKLIPVLYPGVTVPDQVGAGLGTGGREDIATIFLTGIPGVNQPAKVKPSEMLRINTSMATGFPNGRLLTDDVTDVALRVIAGATAFTPEFNIAPNNQLGDGVDANDKPFLTRFPYVGTPESGY